MRVSGLSGRSGGMDTHTPTWPGYSTPTGSGVVLVGDCLDRLRELPDASVDSIVTDPPYEIGFMGRSWDSTGIAYNVELWAEVLRVVKPGGHLLAFGATRSYHRMAVAIEDAGFEIRDSLHWTYGSGFPKSHSVAKALEAKARTGSSSPTALRKAAMGGDYEPTPLAGTPGYGRTGNFSNKDTGGAELEVVSPEAAAWEGWGTALKPAHEPIVVARKPLAGTVAANVLEWGTGALNIDRCRVGSEVRTYDLTMTSGNFETTGGGKNRKQGTATVAGRWPANVLFTHDARCDGACVSGCPVGELDAQSGVSTSRRPAGRNGKDRAAATFGLNRAEDTVRGHSDSGGASRFFPVFEWDPVADVAPFRYQAKPSKKERNAGLDGLPVVVAGSLGGGTETRPNRGDTRTPRQNHHPTVKPVALMRWLVRLVTPPGGVVLDPFLGSATTAVACELEGFAWVGCELTEEYLPIIDGRTAWAEGERAAGRADRPQFKAPAAPAAEPEPPRERVGAVQPGLFDGEGS